MNSFSARILLAALLFPAANAATLQADVRLPAVLGSHMVLQREQPIAVWGWADAGEEVTVTLGEASAKVATDADGKWSVSLPAQQANANPQVLKVAGKNAVTLEDILIGDVWVGSGQSNMEWPVAASKDAPATIAAANHPTIRLFHIPKVEKPEPASDVVAAWSVCTPEAIPGFSAVLYHFGVKLNQDLKIPVGLINSSWGGSPIEPWTIADGTSGGMYNGMIAPIVPFPIRGAIWYQGETNAMQKNGLAYFDKMQALIAGWRQAWKNDFPFYFVQLAPWEGSYPPGELEAVWEAQVASLKIPHTGMAVTTDLVDNIKDIHPINKQDVGNRLALWALAKNYGHSNLVYSGPLYQSMKTDGNKIRLNFAHVAGGLKTRDDQDPTEFEIAGADGNFVNAIAKIDGNSVVVWADQVAQPTQVRFGWHVVANPNLVNSAGLPASPFRTQDWHGGTGE